MSIHVYNSAINMDGITGALEIIEYEHHEIHSGSSFTVHFDNTTANSDDDLTIQYTGWRAFYRFYNEHADGISLVALAPDGGRVAVGGRGL